MSTHVYTHTSLNPVRMYGGIPRDRDREDQKGWQRVDLLVVCTMLYAEAALNDKLQTDRRRRKCITSRSSYDYCASSNMDYHDLREVTTAPSITSQATFSNATLVPSTRTLSTISERESDFYLPFEGSEKKEDREKSQIAPLAPSCQKLNHDYSRCSLTSDKSISALHESKKESHTRTKDDMNEEDVHSQTCEDTNNSLVAPFVELGAVYKILDLVTDSDSKISMLTNNCYEISRALQSLLARRHKKLEDLLSNDSSLHRCERCGVISCMPGSHPAIKQIERTRTKTGHSDVAAAAERDCVDNEQNNGKSEIAASSRNLINNVRSSFNDSQVNNRTKCKDKLGETLPNKDRSFVVKKYNVESSNEANNMSVTKTSIKNKLYPGNDAVKNLFDVETAGKNKRFECNAARNNSGKCESSSVTAAYASIDREEAVREISYGSKLQIDDLSVRDRCSNKFAEKFRASQRLCNKRSDVYPIFDVVKYLARGEYTELDKKENEFLSKLQERPGNCPSDERNGRSSVLYGSREDCSHRDAGFWLFDESGHLPRTALDEYRYLPTSGVDRDNVSFPANVSRYFHAVEKMKTDNWSKDMEKDSLEECAILEQRRESNATFYSSSSVENLIHGSLDRKYEMNNIDDEDIPRGRQLVSSRPSLDIARHVRAQIAKDKYSGNAKGSTGESYTHDSNILLRLSPETRRKICHLIKTIVYSVKDSASFHKRHLINNVLNSEKLLHTKSADAAFSPSNKTENEIMNDCVGDCVPTKLSDLPEDNPTRKITRQITYKDMPLRNGNNTVAEMLPIYRTILENSRDMDWESFRGFVEVLHPDEKEAWRDVCKIISKEARRINGDTEVCIEISPMNPEEPPKTHAVTTCAQEIVLELDMTLKDVDNFFNKRFAEERLDTHKDAEGL